MATVLDAIIGPALRDIGVLASGDTPAGQDAADALDALNALLDYYKTCNLLIYSMVRTTATLTPSQASFTVGAGGNINVARPVFIDAVAFIDTSTSPTTEYPLEVLNDAAWQGLAQKGLTSKLPIAAFYERTYPLGTLYPWPIATGASLQWVIYSLAAVAEFAAIADVVSLPPAYRRMLTKNLAVELAAAYNREPSKLLIRAAAESMSAVKRVNERPRYMAFDAAALIQTGRGGYDIRTGQ